MNKKNIKTLEAVFELPTRSNIEFADLESLTKALGGAVTEREGSRVVFAVAGGIWHAHRPHPGREAKKYQVEAFREFLESKGIGLNEYHEI